ncbi:GntR family transcriptional regulator [Mesorhizobium sp. CN2-181]
MINRGATVSAQVFLSLRHDIINGALQPGTQLSEQSLSQRFGVSRTPIREAMLRLAEEGLVIIYPQVGTFVTKIALSKVREAQFIREALECAAAGAAVQNATEEDDAILADIMRTQLRCADEGDYETFYLFDEKLHASIAAASGFPRLWTIALAEKVQLDRVRYLNMNSAADLDALVAQHQAIVDAIAKRDKRAAEAATRRHLRDVFHSIEGLIAAHGSFFEQEPSGSTGKATQTGRRRPPRMPG